MTTNRIENAKRLAGVSKMVDTALMGGTIGKEEHRLVKRKVKGLELDNLFKAMADYCKK
jgi:hypothetical protein